MADGSLGDELLELKERRRKARKDFLAPNETGGRGKSWECLIGITRQAGLGKKNGRRRSRRGYDSRGGGTKQARTRKQEVAGYWETQLRERERENSEYVNRLQSMEKKRGIK